MPLTDEQTYILSRVSTSLLTHISTLKVIADAAEDQELSSIHRSLMETEVRLEKYRDTYNPEFWMAMGYTDKEQNG